MSADVAASKGGIGIAMVSFVTSFFVVETLQIIALCVTIAASVMSFVASYRRNQKLNQKT